MTTTDGIGLATQIACVKREIGMRRKVYPRWVADGRMTQARADNEIAAMEAVHQTLEALLVKELEQIDLFR